MNEFIKIYWKIVLRKGLLMFSEGDWMKKYSEKIIICFCYMKWVSVFLGVYYLLE